MKLKMSIFQLKITYHSKNPEKSQSEWEKTIGACTKMMEMLELSDKDFKAAIIKMLW